MSSTERRGKRFLSAEQKYDLWVRMLTGQITTVEAATEAGVDRSTIMSLKRVARDGAIAALEASRPGDVRPKPGTVGEECLGRRASDRHESRRQVMVARSSGRLPMVVRPRTPS